MNEAWQGFGGYAGTMCLKVEPVGWFPDKEFFWEIISEHIFSKYHYFQYGYINYPEHS